MKQPTAHLPDRPIPHWRSLIAGTVTLHLHTCAASLPLDGCCLRAFFLVGSP